jgi:hypothetical protein
MMHRNLKHLQKHYWLRWSKSAGQLYQRALLPIVTMLILDALWVLVFRDSAVARLGGQTFHGVNRYAMPQ